MNCDSNIKSFFYYWIASYLFFVALACVDNKFGEPPERGDGHDYDAIAFSIAFGEGYGTHWDSPSWRAPYEAPAHRAEFAELLQRRGEFSPTLYRAPGLPYFLAAIYKTFGRNFVVVRSILLAFCTLSIALLCLLITRFTNSPQAALLMLLGCAADPWMVRFFPEIMTEGLSTLLISSVFFCIFFPQYHSIRSRLLGSFLCGILLGFLPLVRAQMMPAIPLLAGVASIKMSPRCLSWHSILNFGWIILISAAVFSPWIIHCMSQSEGRFPFGTMAPTNLVEGFSDRALAKNGMWSGEETQREMQLMPPTMHSLIRSRFEGELVNATYLYSKARAWISNHPKETILLFLLKVRSLLFVHATFFGFILVWCGFFALVFSKKPEIRQMSGLALLCVSWSVGLTWDVPIGRFFFPVHPLLLAISACMLHEILTKLSLAKS